VSLSLSPYNSIIKHQADHVALGLEILITTVQSSAAFLYRIQPFLFDIGSLCNPWILIVCNNSIRMAIRGWFCKYRQIAKKIGRGSVVTNVKQTK
jgi:hypothetical protein